jgi:hypothetical protein
MWWLPVSLAPQVSGIVAGAIDAATGQRMCDREINIIDVPPDSDSAHVVATVRADMRVEVIERTLNAV